MSLQLGWHLDPKWSIIACLIWPDLAGLKVPLFLIAPPGLLTVLLASVYPGLLIIIDHVMLRFIEVAVKSTPRIESCSALPALVVKSARGSVRCRLTVGDRHVDHNL